MLAVEKTAVTVLKNFQFSVLCPALATGDSPGLHSGFALVSYYTPIPLAALLTQTSSLVDSVEECFFPAL